MTKKLPSTMQQTANEAEQWIEDIMRGSTRDTHYTQAVMLEAAKRIHRLASIIHDLAKGAPMTDKLPELPSAQIVGVSGLGVVFHGYTADALRSYAEEAVRLEREAGVANALAAMTDRAAYEAWAERMVKRDQDARAFDYPAWEAWQEAVRLEREACAKLCEWMPSQWGEGKQCAAEIRARSEVIDYSASPIN